MHDNYPQYAIHAANGEITRNLETALRLTDSVERGLDLLQRLNDHYKMEDQISDEVIDFIGSYESICGEMGMVPVDIYPGTEGVFQVVKNICRSIWNLICRIWDKIKACFRWLFNAQYRASKEAIRCSQQIAQLKANKDASEVFLRYEVDAMLSPEHLSKYLDATFALIDMLEKIKDINTIEGLNDMIRENVGNCGLTFVGNEFQDTLGKPPYKRGTYKSIGWQSVDQIFEMSKRHVEAMRKTVVLKNLEKDLSADVASLKRKQDARVEDGDDITQLSDELNLKLKQYKLILAGQSALMERVEVLAEEFSAIAEDAYDVEHETYKEDDDDD